MTTAVDSNVLVYAHRPESSLHDAAIEAIRNLAEGQADWVLPWPCLHEFYAVVTNGRIFAAASTPLDALSQIEAWTQSPTVRVVAEGPGHLEMLTRLVVSARSVGGAIFDAKIAAICLSHGVTELLTMDSDFSRFPALRTRSLLA